MKFVEYDWDSHLDVVLESDSWEVMMMKTHDEETDGNFIWKSAVGGFWVFNTWDELDIYNNQF